MAEKRRLVDLIDFHQKTTVRVTAEQLTQLKQHVWAGRKFELVYMHDGSEMFTRPVRLRFYDHDGNKFDYTVKYVLGPKAYDPAS